MTNQIHIIKRGCGWPVAGKIYMSVPATEEKGGFYGTPIWDFVVCPTAPLGTFEISAQGMTDVSRQCTNAEGKEIFDIWDWIGASNYPNPTDWLLEADKFGFHQLIERTFPFEKLTPESMYLAVHPRAGIKDIVPYYHNRIHTDYPDCPQNHELHITPTEEWLNLMPDTCAGLFFNDLVEGNKLAGAREVERAMPSFNYQGFSAPIKSLEDSENHYPAIFFKLPIGRIGDWLVYEDSAEKTHEDALKELERLDKKLQRIQIVQL
jgi:hypothetical protein